MKEGKVNKVIRVISVIKVFKVDRVDVTMLLNFGAECWEIDRRMLILRKTVPDVVGTLIIKLLYRLKCTGYP